MIIDLDTNKQAAIDWINASPYHWTEWGYDDTTPEYHPIFAAYKAYCNDSTGIPQTYVIDNDANVRWSKLGMISDPSAMISVIEELI